MIIYQSSTTEFVRNVLENRIADLMKDTYEKCAGRRVGKAEYASWQNSTQYVKNIVDLAALTDNMIALEYEVPYSSSRIDCLLFGRGKSGSSNVVLMELKQWTSVAELEDEGNYVETYVGGQSRIVPHPSQQVEGYHDHLLAFVEAFEMDDALDLFSCAYCHNYTRVEGQGLHSPIYKRILEKHPVYSKGDVKELASTLRRLLETGSGLEIFNRFMQSRIRPSRKLLEYTSKMLDGERSFSLLDEQIVAKNLIMSKIDRAQKEGVKSVVVVQGGPGTGKSVIAIHILAELAGKGQKVFWGCKSKPFVSAMKDRVGEKGSALFSNLYRFLPNRVGPDEIDVVLVDEAHRIEKTSNFQYTKKEDRTDMPQVEQLVRCAKTAVFFVDDKQNVRAQEIGSTDLIRSCAEKYGRTLDTVALLTQFRCNGSSGYLAWLESALGYSPEKRRLQRSDGYDFRIFDSPHSLWAAVRQKESQKPNSARLVAGYCWPWSDPNDDGSLVKDVVIGDFAMPWEAKEGKKLQAGIPRWYQWAYKTEAVNQVGCIYTAQGFEFDYIGVIFADDLVYDPAVRGLVGNRNASSDPTLNRDAKNFDSYVRNIYRVLMTRGMQGCYVHFLNKATELYFRDLLAPDMVEPVPPEPQKLIPFENALPLVPLRAVADADFVSLDGFFRVLDDYELIAVPGGPFGHDRFLVRAEGDSMEPRIKDGQLCLFRKDPGGSRNGKIVLCRVGGFAGDAPVALIKQYRSARTAGADSIGEAEAIVLSSLNKKHKDIILTQGTDLSVMGIFERVVEE
jgi:uncharacterized protein